MAIATVTAGEPLQRLNRDLLDATRLLGRREVRYIVDAYYMIQEHRKAVRNQQRALTVAGEPDHLPRWLGDQLETLEKQIRRAMDAWTDAHTEGRWAKSIMGIGPVLAAGLLAHIDIEKAPTVGHIWRFAGLDPTVRWERGQKRPWNASLKTLCWKIGESFVKVKGHPQDVYGKVYEARRRLEEARNARGEYAEQAARILAEKRIGKDTVAYRYYSQGKLPPAHIHARAKRYAVKLFLAHLHHVMYEVRFGSPPPKPYVIEHLGHAHFIAPPNWPM
ncbi:MAG TPA: transposase [Calditerricola sp.]